MTDETPIHLGRAEESLKAANVLLQQNLFSDSISRSYYATFHCAKAVLARLGVERKSHQAVWAEFGKLVAVPGYMDKKYHSGGVRLFANRMDSDYLPNPKDTREDAQKAFSFAKDFVAACRAYLESKKPKGGGAN